MLITYNRKNTMIKSHYGNYYRDLNEIEKVHYPGFLDFEERIVKKTIQYEVNKLGENFDLKGIHRKYDQYCRQIDELCESYFKNQLYGAAIRIEPFEYVKALKFEDKEVSFTTLYAICQKIFPGLNKLLFKEFGEEIEIYRNFMKLYQGSYFQYTFPTVIEWFDQSAIEDYRNKLEKIYKNDKRMVEKSISVLTKIVYSNIKIE